MKRRTLRQPASITGPGVFLGRMVSVTLNPADAGSGLRFRRLDADLQVAATLDSCLEHETCSGLTDGRCSLLAVEHLLSVLHAFQITDLEVIVSGGELPFFDSTAQPWAELVEQAGVVELDAEVEPLVIAAPIRVGGQKKWIEARPGPGLRLSYTLVHPHPLIGTATAEYIQGLSDYTTDFAPAQSFITLEEARRIYEKGLYPAELSSFQEGLDLFSQRALIVYEDHYSAPLRLVGEFPKHKIVDLLGDLYLLGRPVQGHITAYRTGHRENRALVRKLLAA